MSKVTSEEVKKIAMLSKINLEGDELKNLTDDFNQILNFVQTISKVDTEHVPPMKHVLSYDTPQNEDIPKEHLPLNTIQKIAPKFEAGYFVVPRVIEHNG